MKKDNVIKYGIISVFVSLYLIVSTISMIHSIDFFGLSNSNGMALAGVIALIAAVINAVIFAVQQMIADIKGINKKALWTIEILIIVAGILYVAIHGISIG